jgi:hypothetical protein
MSSKEVECPMCYDIYDEGLKTPRNLHCGHTVCEDCINIAFRKKKSGIVCPICRFAHDPKIKGVDLSKNYVAAEIASKQRQLQNKLQFCPKHKEPQQFFCEDDSEYFCIECIIHHSGHHFVKQEYSVPLMKEKITAAMGRLEARQAEASALRRENQQTCDEMESRLLAEHAKLDAEFDRLVLILNERRAMLKEEISAYYRMKAEGLREEATRLEDYGARLTSDRAKLHELVQKLDELKVIKNSQELNEFNETFQTVEAMLKEELVYEEKDAELPGVTFRVDLTQDLKTYGHYQMLVRPRICFFGERRKMLYYDIEKQNWFFVNLPTTSAFSTELNYYSAAASFPTGELLITGGGASNAVYMVTFSEKTRILPRQSMLFCRKEHSCVFLAGHIYVISGYDGKNKVMNYSCERYSLAKDEWARTGDVNTPRCAFAAASIADQFIYIFGGFDGHERMKSIECYDLKTGLWTVIATELRHPLSNSAAIGFKSSEIIVLGGGYNQGFSHEVMKFDILTQAFTDLSRMAEGRDLRNKVVKHKGELFAIGGNSFDGEKFNVRSGKWEALPQYGSFVLDNLDSWCCALSFESDSRYLERFLSLNEDEEPID